MNSAWRQHLNFQVYTFIDSPWFQGGTPAINPVCATQVQYTSVWPFSENKHPLFCWDGVIVKLCVYLTVLTDAQIAGKTLFLGVSVRVFLEEINI